MERGDGPSVPLLPVYTVSSDLKDKTNTFHALKWDKVFENGKANFH